MVDNDLLLNMTQKKAEVIFLKLVGLGYNKEHAAYVIFITYKYVIPEKLWKK